MRKIANILLSVICVAVIAGCGRSDSKPASQVAVKVNGEEISVHQMNSLLGRMGVSDASQAERARTQALDRLIDQEVVIQKAVETKIDRDANVIGAVDAARRQILVQAYLERVAAASATATPEEIREYYVQHPELFSKRRIYRFQELAAATTETQRTGVEEQVKKSRSLNQIATWMRDQKIPFNADTSLKAAEQLPIALLPKLQTMKPGEVQVFPGSDRVLVLQLVASQEVPLNEKEAEPFIARFIAGQKRADAGTKELRKLRAAAKVEFVGEFAKTAAQPAAKAAAAPADADAMNKGLKGLK